MRHALAVRLVPALLLLLSAGCGSSSQPSTSSTPTPSPGIMSSTGPETAAVGELYTSNWRSSDFAGTALRTWTASGSSFLFSWSTTAGDQIGRIGRAWNSPGLGVRVDDVKKPCIMSTTAEAKDVASGGFLIWGIYGWTHSDHVAWPSPNGYNNEFYVTFRSWNGSYNGPNTQGGGYVSIGSVTIDGVDFDGYVNDMPWGTPNQTQWVIEARNASWTGSIDLAKAFAFWRSKGLPNEYVVDLTWALEAGAGAGGSSGEIQLTSVVVPTLR